MMRRSGASSAVKRWKLACEMLRRAASGHIEAMQLSKFAAASRIALAVIRGWPEAPSSPLHGRGPALAEAGGVGTACGVWLAFDDEPPKMLPRKSSGPLDCARACPTHSSIAASSTVPARFLAGLVAGPIMSHPKGIQAAGLELRLRSSQAIAATSDANFGIKGALATC